MSECAHFIERGERERERERESIDRRIDIFTSHLSVSLTSLFIFSHSYALSWRFSHGGTPFELVKRGEKRERERKRMRERGRERMHKVIPAVTVNEFCLVAPLHK